MKQRIMKISEILTKRKKGFAFEFFPPRTRKGLVSLNSTAKILKRCDPLYMSMTYGAGGKTRETTREAIYMLKKDKDLTLMPHLTSVGAGKDDLKLIIEEYAREGIVNIMALRGDPPLDEAGFDFSCQEISYACDLVKFIKEQGDFCVGVAVYPEGHIECSNLDKDMYYTRKKIDAGADFAVTQMFFDNRYFYSLLQRMKKNNIEIPVVPGILPLTNIDKVKQFSSLSRTTIPKEIEKELNSLRNYPREMEKTGVEFTIRQCRDLLNNGVTRFHFFTLNKPKVITTILEALT
ncbi:MAG: methylenetetrahydrofolate reductase [NAD(P)H] [Candidatus Omnitrophica bacterium]|nr:methylenetetrahydrofolate reductase [NAD(P)H] [Candidatus Omnitrophota bacterium]MBD3269502.1 methylenetetrahydrofolate reductase [NAD(P)H] [Candidatus Omnitrophota bacterium]